MKNCIKMLVFVAIFTYILFSVNTLLEPKSKLWCRNMYELPKNSADVMFFGSSNVYSNINPAILYEQQGITSYIMAGSGQPIWNSYYYLREAYKTQQPKLVVIDMKSLIYDVDYTNLAEAYTQIEGLKLSRNKLAAIESSTDSDELSLLFGWPIYHTRWKDGEKLFQKVEDKYGAMQMGFYPVDTLAQKFEYGFKPDVSSNIQSMTAKNEQYLRQMIELAQQHGSDVLLLKTPYVINEYADSIYNYAEQIASEYQIESLNMNKIDFNFLYNLEMVDTEHLNHCGVEKTTNYLGEFLKQNYNLPDRRNEDNSWDGYLALYQNTQFQCPYIVSREMLFTDEDLSIDKPTGSVPDVLEYPIHLETGKWYEVNIDMEADSYGRYVIDLYSVENYDKGEQDRYITIYPGQNRATARIYSGDAPIPENTVFRIIVPVGLNCSFDINYLEVNKLTVEE